MPGEGPGKSLVSGQPVGLAEADEPLMAVELPDDFAVPHRRRVEGVEPAPVRERRPTSRDRIEVPVDGIAENEPAVAQEIEATLADGLGGGHDLVAGLGHAPRQKARHRVAHYALEEASGADGLEAVDQHAGRFPRIPGRSSRQADALQPLRGFLPAATGQLRDTHAQQPARPHAAPQAVRPAAGAPSPTRPPRNSRIVTKRASAAFNISMSFRRRGTVRESPL